MGERQRETGERDVAARCDWADPARAHFDQRGPAGPVGGWEGPEAVGELLEKKEKDSRRLLRAGAFSSLFAAPGSCLDFASELWPGV